MKKDNLIHGERAAEPCLIDISTPFSRRALYQRFLEFDIGQLLDGSLRAPQSRIGIGGFPFLQVKVMEFVGAYEMPDRTQTVHSVAQISGQLYWRPYPEAAVRQSGDDRTRWIRKAKEADNLSFCDPKSVMHLFEHVSPRP